MNGAGGSVSSGTLPRPSMMPRRKFSKRVVLWLLLLVVAMVVVELWGGTLKAGRRGDMEARCSRSIRASWPCRVKGIATILVKCVDSFCGSCCFSLLY